MHVRKYGQTDMENSNMYYIAFVGDNVARRRSSNKDAPDDGKKEGKLVKFSSNSAAITRGKLHI